MSDGKGILNGRRIASNASGKGDERKRQAEISVGGDLRKRS